MLNMEVYITRRNRVRELLNSGLILILGNTNSPYNYPANTYRFRQDSTFLYFFGIDEPGLAAIIDVDNNRELIFGDDLTPVDVIWKGPGPSMADKASKVGVSKTMPFAKIFDFISDALKRSRSIHFTPPYRAENKLLLGELLGIPPGDISSYSSALLVSACVKLRSTKEDVEIAEMQSQMEVAYKMHTTAMQMCQPGVSEMEIAGAIEGISLSNGGMVAFPVICSKRGEVLHNHYHGNLLQKGDLLLLDAGSESPLHYATDNTRVMPVGGRFTTRQRDIYNVVLKANNVAREAMQPGINFKEVHLLASKIIASGLVDLGLMRGDVDEAVANGAHALFFPHGLGHMIGLDVHDMEDYSENMVGYDAPGSRSSQFGLNALRFARTLQVGFTVTNEPGIYFIPELIESWKSERKHHSFINYNALDGYLNFGGIRLEDVIHISHSGPRVLGRRIPITPEEVESEVQKGELAK